MKSWPVQDAKARFSEMLETCLREGPQMVTRRGEDAAVLVPVGEWERLKRPKYANLKEWLLAEEPKAELKIPSRSQWRMRKPPKF
jgi:prevent-host-death family protein